MLVIPSYKMLFLIKIFLLTQILSIYSTFQNNDAVCSVILRLPNNVFKNEYLLIWMLNTVPSSATSVNLSVTLTTSNDSLKIKQQPVAKFNGIQLFYVTTETSMK